jgi:hypothetical protein
MSTSPTRKANIISLVVVLVFGFAYLIGPKPLALILLLFATIPPAILDGIGVGAMGTGMYGFFAPSPLGYVVAALAYWGVFWLIAWLGMRAKLTRAIVSKELSSNKSLERTREG